LELKPQRRGPGVLGRDGARTSKRGAPWLGGRHGRGTGAAVSLPPPRALETAPGRRTSRRGRSHRTRSSNVPLPIPTPVAGCQRVCARMPTHSPSGCLNSWTVRLGLAALGRGRRAIRGTAGRRRRESADGRGRSPGELPRSGDGSWMPSTPFCLSMIFSENRYPLFRIML